MLPSLLQDALSRKVFTFPTFCRWACSFVENTLYKKLDCHPLRFSKNTTSKLLEQSILFKVNDHFLEGVGHEKSIGLS